MTTESVTADLPAIPARGNTTTIPVASRTTPGTAYTVTVSVAVWTGTVATECDCPARRGCWHRDTVERIYIARGEAERNASGALVTTEAPAVGIAEPDPFSGLLGEAVAR